MPPLYGDKQGRYRVKITGNSGSGKTTLGKALASILNVPYISLDALFWQPGWRSTPNDDFCLKVRQALDQEDNGWVVDGDYTRRLGDVVEREATDIVWLDPPLLLYFPRLCYRTLLRLLRLRAPCSPGCPESFREVFFSKDSIIWWCLSQHWYNRKRNRTMMREMGGTDHVGVKMRRIGGWGSELREWKSEVQVMIQVTVR